MTKRLWLLSLAHSATVDRQNQPPLSSSALSSNVSAKSDFDSCYKRGDTTTGKHVDTLNDFSKLDSRIEGLHRTNSFLRSTREGPQKAEDKNRKRLPAVRSGFAAHPRGVWRDLRRR